ncbi:TetR/AcrR family transcriptional regulator [Nioella nitratireducens]|uniref:TetR/AcrR family transcriptional regulator n=1 Tax=Nioella nitratireducens TaxID=1287720 RepID=UPI0008FD8751|nr:TetR family transcriptional regulator [Nioella nitratireducens]
MATTLFAFGGAEAVTVARISARSGLGRATVYGYFADAGDLAAEVEEAAVLRLGRLMSDTRFKLGPRRLRWVVSQMLHRGLAERETARLLVRLWRDRQDVRLLLEGTLRADLRAAGSAAATLEAKVMAATLVGLVEAVLLGELRLHDLDSVAVRVMGCSEAMRGE